MSAGHRLFFALVPDADVRQRVAELQRTIGGGGRAVKADNFHVTLAFLGSQPPAAIPVLQELASRLDFRRCNVTLDTVGSFSRSGVVWLGPGAVPAELQAFRDTLVDALDRAGIRFDRKHWHFHLTLYRRLRKAPPIMQPIAIAWRLHGFSLMESISVDKGVEYHSLGRWETSH